MLTQNSLKVVHQPNVAAGDYYLWQDGQCPVLSVWKVSSVLEASHRCPPLTPSNVKQEGSGVVFFLK